VEVARRADGVNAIVLSLCEAEPSECGHPQIESVHTLCCL